MVLRSNCAFRTGQGDLDDTILHREKSMGVRIQVGWVCTCADVELVAKTAGVPTVIHHTKSVTSKCKGRNDQDGHIVLNFPGDAQRTAARMLMGEGARESKKINLAMPLHGGTYDRLALSSQGLVRVRTF